MGDSSYVTNCKGKFECVFWCEIICLGQCGHVEVHCGIDVHTPLPKLFILSDALSTIAVETADQELYPHPYGFTSSSSSQPSLPSPALSSSLSPPWFVHLQPLLPLPVFLTYPIFPSVFLLLLLFSISVFLISPELLLTHLLFFSLFLLSLPAFFLTCWHYLFCYPCVAD